MKKKTVKSVRSKKTVTKKPVHRAKRATRRAPSETSFVSVRRLVIITTCLFLFVSIVSFVNSGNVTGSVAGISVARGLFSQATISLAAAPPAVSYNIYYKQSNEGTYTHAVSHISPDVKAYTISYLKKNTSYIYRISAVDGNGKEFWWSPAKWLTGITPM